MGTDRKDGQRRRPSRHCGRTFLEPTFVSRGFDLGVHAIVIGSAITRPWMVTERFVQFSPQGKAKKS